MQLKKQKHKTEELSPSNFTNINKNTVASLGKTHQHTEQACNETRAVLSSQTSGRISASRVGSRVTGCDLSTIT